MFDYSDNNHPPVLADLWAKGYRVLALKFTESDNYYWDKAPALATEWRKLGGTVWGYHFMRPGNGAGQGRWFIDHAKGYCDRLVADCEVSGVDGKLVDAFWASVRSVDVKDKEEDYGGCYFLRDNGIKPDHEQGLWLAEYASHVAFIPPGWKEYDAWQNTDAAIDPSTGSRVDSSVLAPVKRKPKRKPVKPKRHRKISEFLPVMRTSLALSTRRLNKHARRGDVLVGDPRVRVELLVDAAKAALAGSA